MRSKIILACAECGSRNYSTDKNKQAQLHRIELRKFCKLCSAHTIHRETK